MGSNLMVWKDLRAGRCYSFQYFSCCGFAFAVLVIQTTVHGVGMYCRKTHGEKHKRVDRHVVMQSSNQSKVALQKWPPVKFEHTWHKTYLFGKVKLRPFSKSFKTQKVPWDWTIYHT